MIIGFVGAGNMATALARAIEAAEPGVRFIASDVDETRLQKFCGELSDCSPVRDNRKVPAEADVVFLAVKPQVMPKVLPDLTGSNRLFVSVAAGITLSTLEAGLPDGRIIRVMPNTPGLVGAMAAGYAGGSRVSSEDLALVGRLLSRAGVAVEVPEDQINAVTGVSGSGPAYVARLIEAFSAAGERNGLSHETANKLALATFAGTARLLQETEMTPDELVRMVSSPNGTTVAGREVLEASDISEVIGRTVDATVTRSKELGA